jgi:amidase
VNDTIATWPAHRQAAAIAAKEISSRELLDLYLRRIDAINPRLNAVVSLDAERGRRAAHAADDALANGRNTGPLHGLPITIKDAIEVQDLRSTGGAAELTDHVPSADAVAVARLRAAGAVIFGKTNVPRWSGDIQTYNEIFGTTNNPWDVNRTPGGSSGGAAAAVAAGLSSFELGTDIGGSVRIPSHLCGVFGLKPSYGVIPQRGYLDHVGGGTTDADINVLGPITRDATDLAVLLDVLAGPEPERAVAWRLDLPAPDTTRAFRVGVWIDEPSIPIDAEVRAILYAAVDAIEAAGMKVEDAHPPVDFAEQVAVFNNLVIGAISPSMPNDIADAMSGTHREWLRMDVERARFKKVWANWFEHYDLLMCPVLPVAAFPHDHTATMMERTIEINGASVSHLDLVKWPGLIGVVGLPSAVPPVGRTTAGLPVGVQLVGPYLHDRSVVHAAGMIGTYNPPPGC